MTKLTSIRCPLQKEQGGERPIRRSLPTGRRCLQLVRVCSVRCLSAYCVRNLYDHNRSEPCQVPGNSLISSLRYKDKLIIPAAVALV